MPYRKIPIITGEIYHVFNRSIARQPIFLNQRDYERILAVLYFYSFDRPKLRFSHYNRLSYNEQKAFLEDLIKNNTRLVDIIAFCFMPNHLHLLIKEIKGKGISTLMAKLQHSYAKYFNTKNKRTGSVFQAMFKIVRIETDEQLLHVTRYIHLNPLTSYILKDINQLENYPWSSYMDYFSIRKLSFINKNLLLGFFSSKNALKKFTSDQVDYQRKLGKIKHLLFE